MDPIERWNSGKICSLIDQTWDERKTIEKKLQKKIPLLKDKAKKANILLCEFLKHLTPKSN